MSDIIIWCTGPLEASVKLPDSDEGPHCVYGSNPYELGYNMRKKLEELDVSPDNVDIDFSLYRFGQNYFQDFQRGLSGK